MTARQKLLIAALIAAPIAIGLALLIAARGRSSGIIGELNAKKIGLVRIFDVIYTSDDYVWQLKELRTDKSVAGVIVRIESPGGAVAPSQEIYAEMLKYRTDGKPCVVSMGNIAASGGYYIASPATKIFANPGTLTGSIGVIMQFPKYYGLLEKIGMKVETVKAGRFKDIGSPHRDMSNQERALFQALLDETHEQFIRHVSDARGMDVDSLRRIADGSVYTGSQALHLGLVDSLGGFEDAAGYLRRHLGLPEKTRFMEKKRGRALWRDVLLEETAGVFSFVNSFRRPAGAYYLLEVR
jgi:protease-4